MTSLYEISQEYRAAAEKLANMDLDPQTISDTLEGLSGDLEAKSQNVVYFARNLEATATAIKDAEAKMAERRKSLENRAKGLRTYVLTAMQHAGIEKIECPHFKISIRKNPVAVEIFEEGLIPPRFMVRAPQPAAEPDKEAIKEVLQAGENVAGARLTRGVRLEVK